MTATDAIITLWVGDESIIFASHDDLDELYPDLLPETDEAPCPAIITLEVADLEATTRVLASATSVFPAATFATTSVADRR